MMFGKIIAFNPDMQRGIIEDRYGDTWKFERKDMVNDLDYLKIDLEVSFEPIDGTREVYLLEANSGQFTRYHNGIGRYIP